MTREDLDDLRDLLDRYAENLRDRIAQAETQRDKDPLRIRGEVKLLRDLGRRVTDVRKALR